MSEPARGILFVVSAPSGTGKTTLASRLVSTVPTLSFSVSYTTRKRRAGESEDRAYHFIDDACFDDMVSQEAFIEWASVHGSRYGTGREATEAILREGGDLLLDIDVQGARQVRQSPIESVSIFVMPPNYSVLEARLTNRASESEPDRSRRLDNARKEAEDFRNYDYVVVNDELERASDELRAIVLAERSRVRRRADEAARILSTFPGGWAGGGREGEENP